MTDCELTERQRYWFEHLKAAQGSGMTVVAYAAEQGLKAKELYNWKSRFIKRGWLSVSLGAKDFVPVRVDGLARCCVHLSNGVRVEFSTPLSDRVIREVLDTASRLA